MLTTLLLLAGLALLIFGAEALVRGASRVAAAVGVSPLIIGLTVVAFGTSSPELAVGARAALAGSGDVAVGNVVGSNIFNILVIIGLSATIVPLVVNQQLVRLDLPLVIVLSLLVLLLGLNGTLGRVEGLLLFLGLLAYVGFQLWISRREGAEVQTEYVQEFGDARNHSPRRWVVNLGLIAAGLAMLAVGADWLVDSAASIARAFGVSELVISLTIVAAGTSAPEVATSAMAAVRGERDIAVGNAVGSNIFNILGVLGLSAALAPEGIAVSSAALRFDIPVMIAVAVAALPVFFTGYTIERWEGALFLLLYGGYVLFLYLDAVQSRFLSAYTSVMLLFVLPPVGLTLTLVTIGELRKRRQARAQAQQPASQDASVPNA
ncbi:MAG: calcium/sodium antiporter [Caldilineales bacterium]|nr:calcium/sodium antiporter [Caldilineales bacterium]MDW8318166.1 calcium/sodium antiporter [Anaerolineae bacterium]